MKSAKTNNNSAYGYCCESCEGIVRPKQVEREAFKHKKGFVILEDVVIGVCDTCGSRYYSADILHAVNDIAKRNQAVRENREDTGRAPLNAIS